MTIAVSVSAPTRYTLLDGFEGTTPGFTAKGGTVTLDTAQVKYGKQSLKLAYQDGASVALSSPRTLAETDRYVSLWVYGDQSGLHHLRCLRLCRRHPRHPIADHPELLRLEAGHRRRAGERHDLDRFLRGRLEARHHLAGPSGLLQRSPVGQHRTLGRPHGPGAGCHGHDPG